MAPSTPAEFASYESGCLHYTNEASDYGKIRTLPAVWKAYLKDFPETGHGKTKKKDPEIGSFKQKTFTAEFGGRVGRSPSTIHEWHQKAVFITEHLDAEAEASILGTPLANKVDIIMRIARIPQAKIQLDLVNLYDRKRPRAKRELEKWERCFFPPPPQTEESPDGDSPSRESEPVVEDSEKTSKQMVKSLEGQSDWLEQVLASLGASTQDEVIPAIEKLKSEIAQLRRQEAPKATRNAAKTKTGKKSAQSCDNDQDEPSREGFVALVTEAVAELPTAARDGFAVVPGRQDNVMTTAIIETPYLNWAVEWRPCSWWDEPFEFKPGKTSSTIYGTGTPQTVGEMRAALLRGIQRYVLKDCRERVKDAVAKLKPKPLVKAEPAKKCDSSVYSRVLKTLMDEHDVPIPAAEKLLAGMTEWATAKHTEQDLIREVVRRCSASVAAPQVLAPDQRKAVASVQVPTVKERVIHVLNEKGPLRIDQMLKEFEKREGWMPESKDPNTYMSYVLGDKKNRDMFERVGHGQYQLMDTDPKTLKSEEKSQT